MPEEYFNISWVNFTKAILWGRIKLGRDDYGVTQEKEIEQVLTEQQLETLRDLEERHYIEKRKLLSSFVVRG